MSKTIFTGANRTIVAVLREARLEAGLTQAQLAERIGRDQSHISLIEGSQRRLDLLEFRQLCRAMGLPPTEVFKRIDRALDE